MALRMGQHTWAIQFLEEHKKRIMGLANPEDAYRFNLAMCRFYLGNYEAVLDELGHSYDDIFYKIAAKRLEIKTLYELRSPILEARMEAFSILVFRMGGKQLSEVYVKGNKQFIAFLRRILNPSTLHNDRRILKLQHELRQEPTVVEKDWLLHILDRIQTQSLSGKTGSVN